MLQKYIMAVRAKPGLTRAQALQHLREKHAVLVSASHTMRTRLKRYVQNHGLDEPSTPDATSERDWIIEGLIDPNVELPEPPVAPDAVAVREDEARFPDRETLVRLLVEPQVVFGDAAPAGAFKVFHFYSYEDSAERARHLSAPAALPREIHNIVQRFAARFERNIVVKSVFRDPPEYDCVDVLWFDSLAGVAAFYDDAAVQEILPHIPGASVSSSLATFREFRLLTRENVVFCDA